jgi:hypothetical protein
MLTRRTPFLDLTAAVFSCRLFICASLLLPRLYPLPLRVSLLLLLLLLLLCSALLLLLLSVHPSAVPSRSRAAQRSVCATDTTPSTRPLSRSS